jgi:hypothetical protein
MDRFAKPARLTSDAPASPVKPARLTSDAAATPAKPVRLTSDAAATPAASPARPASAQEVFSKMDADLIRVLEDLAFVLIEKGVIRLEELPPHAQAKLLDRVSFRERIQRLMKNDGGEIIDALDDSRFGLLR